MIVKNLELLKSFRTSGYCELCGAYALVREPHHLRSRGHGGGHRLDIRINLASLGGSKKLPDGRRRYFCFCHALIQGKQEDAQRILEIVAAREMTTAGLITEVVDWMKRIIKPSPADLCRRLSELSEPGRLLAERELREASLLQEIDVG